MNNTWLTASKKPLLNDRNVIKYLSGFSSSFLIEMVHIPPEEPCATTQETNWNLQYRIAVPNLWSYEEIPWRMEDGIHL